VLADNRKELQHDALQQHDTAAAAAGRVVANADAVHTANALPHKANVVDNQQHVNIPARRDDHANLDAAGGQGQQRPAVGNGISRLDKHHEKDDAHAEQVIDRPDAAAAAAML